MLKQAEWDRRGCWPIGRGRGNRRSPAPVSGDGRPGGSGPNEAAVAESDARVLAHQRLHARRLRRASASTINRCCSWANWSRQLPRSGRAAIDRDRVGRGERQVVVARDRVADDAAAGAAHDRRVETRLTSDQRRRLRPGDPLASTSTPSATHWRNAASTAGSGRTRPCGEPPAPRARHGPRSRRPRRPRRSAHDDTPRLPVLCSSPSLLKRAEGEPHRRARHAERGGDDLGEPRAGRIAALDDELPQCRDDAEDVSRGSG